MVYIAMIKCGALRKKAKPNPLYHLNGFQNEGKGSPVCFKALANSIGYTTTEVDIVAHNDGNIEAIITLGTEGR